VTVTRSDYATAREADVEVLRDAFESGNAYTRQQAHLELAIGDRQFRAAVSELRAHGYPVVTELDDENGKAVYHKARSREELEDFIEAELWSRATDLLEQVHQLRGHAPEHFGEAAQSRLFSA